MPAIAIMSYKMVNFYRNIPQKNQEIFRYPNEDIINIKLPARIILVAPSGEGKTLKAMNFIKAVGTFQKIVLLAKDLAEPLYEHLIEKYRALEKKLNTRILLAIDKIEDLPPLEDWDKTENNLLICDDLICENKKIMTEILEPYWMRGRKKSITCLFLSQGYFDIPKLIRKNSTHIIIGKIKNTKDRMRVFREWPMERSLEQMEALYQQAMKSHIQRGDDRVNNFLLIDTEAQDPDLELRDRFDCSKSQ